MHNTFLLLTRAAMVFLFQISTEDEKKYTAVVLAPDHVYSINSLSVLMPIVPKKIVIHSIWEKFIILFLISILPSTMLWSSLGLQSCTKLCIHILRERHTPVCNRLGSTYALYRWKDVVEVNSETI